MKTKKNIFTYFLLASLLAAGLHILSVPHQKDTNNLLGTVIDVILPDDAIVF